MMSCPEDERSSIDPRPHDDHDHNKMTEEETAPEFVHIDIPSKRVNFLLSGPSSAGEKPSGRSLPPKAPPKNRTHIDSDVEKAATLDSVYTNIVMRNKASTISRSWSFSKIFTPRMKRTSSFHGDRGSINTHVNAKESTRIPRSASEPLAGKEKGILRMNSFFRVIPASSEVSTSAKNDEDIPEEEAVCRICFVELREGDGDTLKMECSCKGELALAHQECAVKWFSIKGNMTCDICKQQVQNLQVTLLRIPSIENLDNQQSSDSREPEINGFRVCQELPILVIVSWLAYFCFLEQLLVGKMDTRAIAISVPFSCALGLISSVTASTMVKRRIVWIYAAIQFTLVVAFAHIFYNLVRVQAVVAILLSTFAGLGAAMSGASILVEISRWRERLSNGISSGVI